MSNLQSAVVLLSGGLDSATCLAIAAKEADQVHALSFDYGQRHSAELQAAKLLSERFQVNSHRVINIDLGQLGGSSLTDHSMSIPDAQVDHPSQDLDHQGKLAKDVIPNTYVPARNTVFLSYGLAVAEIEHCNRIYIGVNAVDYSGYPDCRPEYIAAYQNMANLATKYSLYEQPITIVTPLINLTKAEIIQLGISYDVDYSQTVSCYQADEQGSACGQCDSCVLRKQGFDMAGVPDPTNYFC